MTRRFLGYTDIIEHADLDELWLAVGTGTPGPPGPPGPPVEDLVIERTGTFGQSNWISMGAGAMAVYSELAGSGSIAIGSDSLAKLTTGQGNIGIGAATLSFLVTENNNIAIGDFALQVNTTHDNIGIGTSALRHTTIGNGNVAIGVGAMFANVSGALNVAVGISALALATMASGCTAVGDIAMLEYISGAGNTAVGAETMHGGIAGDQFGIPNGQDGDFSQPGHPLWSFGPGWDSSMVGRVKKNANGTGVMKQADPFGLIDYGTGSRFKCNIVAENHTAGSFHIHFAGVDSPTYFAASGVVDHEWLMTAVNYPAIPGGEGDADVFQIVPSNDARFDLIHMSFVSEDLATGEENTAVGMGAAYFFTTARDNVAIGLGAHRQGTTAVFNVAVGVEALLRNGNGQENVAIGHRALYKSNSSSRCIALGAYAGYHDMDHDVFYVNNQLRADLAADKALSLLFGKMATTAAAQWLQVNGQLNLSFVRHYADQAAALAGGLRVGDVYMNGDTLLCVH